MNFKLLAYGVGVGVFVGVGVRVGVGVSVGVGVMVGVGVVVGAIAHVPIVYFPTHPLLIQSCVLHVYPIF